MGPVLSQSLRFLVQVPRFLIACGAKNYPISRYNQVDPLSKSSWTQGLLQRCDLNISRLHAYPRRITGRLAAL